jgi:DNA-binding beta-propeller fold protein YncE
VAIGSDGRVWATDSGNHRLVLFTADLTGSRHIGQRGSGRGEFSNPIGVAVAPSGEVFVADAGNRRVQVLGPTGGFHREIRVAGWSESVEPHLEVDEGGTLYVTDPAGNLLLVYDGAGRLAARLSQGDAGDAFSRPTGLALDRKGRILYVVNSGSNRVSRINLSGKTWQ